jgi:AcrR family transcriptional regulator
MKPMMATDGQWSDWRHYDGDDDLPPILVAARDAFVQSGYYGSSIRDVAQRCDLSVPGLYHHYASKQALLVGLLDVALDELIGRCRAALALAGDGPVDRLRDLVSVLALYHTHRREMAFLAQSEIRALEPPTKDSIIAKRDEVQRLVDAEVLRGVEQKLFRVDEPLAASRAIVTMCTGITHWYRPGGPLGPEQVAALYIDYSMNLLQRRKTGKAAR